jgi:hypothetical protein
LGGRPERGEDVATRPNVDRQLDKPLQEWRLVGDGDTVVDQALEE